MILAYNNLSDTTIGHIFDEQKSRQDTLEVIAEQNEKGYSRPDLLGGVVDILQKNSVKYSDISPIFFINGPGRFTPVRIAGLIANTFAKESGAKLCPIAMDEFQKSGNDFTNIISAKNREEVHFAEPVFNAPPTIGSPKKIL